MKLNGIWSTILLLSIASPAAALPTLSTSSTTTASSLDLDGEGTATTHIVKVADLSFSTDNTLGLTLQVTSGAITKLAGEDIEFQVVTVPNDASAPAEADFTVPSGSAYTYVTSAAGSEARDLYILYTPSALQDPGDYSGIIDVSVFDN
ncbi:hypothetical protein XM38_022920 [Halomicronema hongdechloris C2206]|uniref:Spore coat protein U domain-containing protein n=1 Tax=Halomicronema hongdechloris C2206 TaxID=1641165 RepID=A0A1Z3HM22_9CYAN|nr:hypothetical protein [Halomicronema hongdechloris]ASC71340.1 hypothetical protein XM38_022920 [Halomicronema hongdechloris C2206]